jgi:hypothetical protein
VLGHRRERQHLRGRALRLVDSGTITCPACGTEHDVASRRDFLLAEAKDYQVTATEAAQALLAWTDYDGTETKLVDRIRKWRDRGHLEVRDVTSLSGRDRHLYRLGDIQVLLIGDAQDAQTSDSAWLSSSCATFCPVLFDGRRAP